MGAGISIGWMGWLYSIPDGRQSAVVRGSAALGQRAASTASPGRDSILAPKRMPEMVMPPLPIGFALHKMHNLIAAPHENRWNLKIRELENRKIQLLSSGRKSSDIKAAPNLHLISSTDLHSLTQ